MKNLLLALAATVILAGCSSFDLEPVGEETARWHGEQHLRSMEIHQRHTSPDRFLY